MIGVQVDDQRTDTLHLTRKLGAFEHLIWSMDQWTPKNMALVARIEGGPVSVDRLHGALRQAQCRHPALSAAINVDTDGYPYFVPTDSPIELCVVERSTETQWQREVEMQLETPFRFGSGPLLRATLVREELISELILVAHHSIGDGISAVYLVRDLLDALEGYQLHELPPRASLEELAGARTSALEEPPTSSGESVRLDKPGPPKVVSFEFETCEVELLMSRCREEGTTVQGALMAAILLSLQDGSVVRCLAPVNMRHLCPPIAEDFGLYISAATAGLDRDSTSDFWTVARLAREQVTRALDAQSLGKRASAMAHLLARNRDPKSLYETFRRGVNYGAVLSNLGRFSFLPTLRQLRVTAIYPVLNVELEPVVAVATAAGRMAITLTSDKPTDTMQIRSFLDEMLTK